MPRPKRSRVASTRIVAKETSPVPIAVPGKPIQNDSDIYDLSDREKDKAKQRRESLHGVNTTRTRSTSAHQTKALDAARQRRDSAMDRLENMTSTSSNQPDRPNEDLDSSIEFGRKVSITPQRRRIGDLSGLDLDDDDFDDLNTTFDTAGPASAQRSADTSSMSASLFKRRPRAGSFLSREDGYIRPSSRTGPNTPGLSSTFNIGVFKRRVREPSILGTAQKPRPQMIEPEPESPSEEEDEEEEEEIANQDGFAPEAQSTPLMRSKRRSGETEANPTSPQPGPNTVSRKRKSSEGHERRARSSPFQAKEPTEDVVQQTDSELSSLPSTPPRQTSRPVTPIMDEELMAPPLSSSSSAGDSEIWPPLQSLARGRTKRPVSGLRRTPVRDDNVSDISSPPSLTHSPNYREPSPPPKRATKSSRRAAASKSEAKITTADLAGLLPRRRRRNVTVDEDSDAEIDISGLGDNDDELSYLDVRARAHPARSSSRPGNTRNRNGSKGGSTSRGKGKQVSSSANKKTAITYSRNSDKENQEEEDVEGEDGGLGPEVDDDIEEDTQQLVARVGEELKDAARKFQEVDKWQLDYEEMTQSSSPRDAR
ncbi:uncharacterized protein GGS25DRAFT_476162 [Hypoxylon fragiforme]|uniref:uncharacterized protein n=1 Tax=Hypoxylon fragiforme TaxID=63214 RepID=UPI0020C5D2EA|nr:uncharacterized protein GGS25DRAFT_476162 [Hypoxylon fragiforme]KAI2612618.1 hypothetical protein GGS25DRAFT_476162 [Hypoxylon fragiforme]